VCARDTGAYIGLFLGYPLLPMRRKHSPGPPHLIMTLMTLAPMMIDAGTQWIGLRPSTNEARLFTGLLFGTGLAPFLVYTLSLVSASKKMPILRNLLPETAELDSKDRWLSNKALLTGLLTAVAFYFIINSVTGSVNAIFYWSLSSLIIASVIWHIFLLPFCLVALYALSLWRRKN